MPFARTPKLDAVLVYLAVRCLGSVAFAMYAVVASVYRIVEAGLDPLQLILVGTVLEVSTFVFEIPTGVVSDVYSRRLSLIIGAFLVGAGFIVEGLFPVFGAVLAAQFLWGVGSTFGSGAEQAWIADETGGERTGQVFIRGSEVAQIGSIVGIAAGVVLASGYIRLPVPDLALPLLAGGSIYFALGLLMALTMPEDGFRPVARRDVGSWTTMVRVFAAGVRIVRRRPTLAAILAIALFYGASSEPIDRLWNLQHAHDHGLQPAGAASLRAGGLVGNHRRGVAAVGHRRNGSRAPRHRRRRPTGRGAAALGVERLRGSQRPDLRAYR